LLLVISMLDLRKLHKFLLVVNPLAQHVLNRQGTARYGYIRGYDPASQNREINSTFWDALVHGFATPTRCGEAVPGLENRQ
jgi:hypothetical protein